VAGLQCLLPFHFECGWTQTLVILDEPILSQTFFIYIKGKTPSCIQVNMVYLTVGVFPRISSVIRWSAWKLITPHNNFSLQIQWYIMKQDWILWTSLQICYRATWWRNRLHKECSAVNTMRFWYPTKNVFFGCDMLICLQTKGKCFQQFLQVEWIECRMLTTVHGIKCVCTATDGKLCEFCTACL
jgi:hypothetical protein